MKLFFLLPPLLVSSLLYGEGLKLISQDNRELLLEGKSESCKITMKSRGEILKTNCTDFVNSKNINIVCTPNKTICKTIKEVDSVLYDKKIVQEKKQPFLKDIKDYPYYNARKIIIKAGYKPKERLTPPEDAESRKAYDIGYKEVVDCSSDIAINPCQFKFHAKYGKTLVVDTYGSSPSVTAWYYE